MGAISAITSVTFTAKTVFGNKRIRIGYVTVGDGSSTWPSGGLSLTASDLGLTSIDMVIFEPKGVQYYYDHDNSKIDGYVCGTAGASNVQVQANGAVIASGEKVYFIVIGTGAA